MSSRRKVLVGGAVGVVVALVTAGSAYAVFALSASTDAALRERSTPSPVAAAVHTPNPTVAGTQAARPSTTPTPTPAPPPKPVLDRGAAGRKVRELQGRLSQVAWFAPPMTGRYDAATARGVSGFQGKRGLARTGTVDVRTWKRLVRMTRMPSADEMFNRSGPALFERGDDGRQVREIQARLRQIAWFFGNVSNHYGDQTVSAVRGFQAKRQVPVTGKVDRRTLQLLEGMTREPTKDDLANRKPDPAEGAALDPRCRTGRALCIDKTTQSLRWVVDGKTRTSLEVRFGASYTPTREGLFHVYWKDRNHISHQYGSAMPFSMFFSRGQAVHYSSDFAARGYYGASHGCVNVRDYDALAHLFDQVVVGDKVVIYWS